MPDELSERVYHGTDAASAESIARDGLNYDARRAAAGGAGPDPKGFSVTTNPGTAAAWARYRAGERGGPPTGVVLEADAARLPLRSGGPDEWTDVDEWFIATEDFPQVGPGVFR